MCPSDNNIIHVWVERYCPAVELPDAKLCAGELEKVMKLCRRGFLRFFAGAAALTPAPGIAWAQNYPSRAVRVMVGYPAGGAADIIARMIGQWLTEHLAQPFVVENRPGAGSNIATEAAAKAPPDGYTLLLASTANAINATLYQKLNFNFLDDITPVAGLARGPNMMVINPSVPAMTVPEFIAYAKANPGKINMASAGNGSPQHVAGELFKQMTGINMIHVPYRGGAPALTDLLGGQVQVYFATVASSMAFINSGQLRALAVTTAMRSEALPDIPAIGEYLPGYEASSWYGLGAPRNTGADIIGKLRSEIAVATTNPEIKKQFSNSGFTGFGDSSMTFDRFVAEDTEKWRNVIRAANITAD
jgi:tripartite-type tricarboxylate transporter receptor subunit TctC